MEEDGEDEEYVIEKSDKEAVLSAEGVDADDLVGVAGGVVVARGSEGGAKEEEGR